MVAQRLAPRKHANVGVFDAIYVEMGSGISATTSMSVTRVPTAFAPAPWVTPSPRRVKGIPLIGVRSATGQACRSFENVLMIAEEEEAIARVATSSMAPARIARLMLM